VGLFESGCQEPRKAAVDKKKIKSTAGKSLSERQSTVTRRNCCMWMSRRSSLGALLSLREVSETYRGRQLVQTDRDF
jgi:hypothetical protein